MAASCHADPGLLHQMDGDLEGDNPSIPSSGLVRHDYPHLEVVLVLVLVLGLGLNSPLRIGVVEWLAPDKAWELPS